MKKIKPFYCPRCGTRQEGVELLSGHSGDLMCKGCKRKIQIYAADDWDYVSITARDPDASRSATIYEEADDDD